ncbi:MAG: nucleotidyltransferase domain-containing protein [Pseudomonadota bacterium]
MASIEEIPTHVQQAINTFVEAAKQAFESELSAIVLYGSAAEGRLRATSDVNMLLVLKRFDQAQADRMREPMRLAHAAVQMNAMFVLETEIQAAMEAFAVKFADIHARHQVLYGNDPFTHLRTAKADVVRRLKQVLLNLQLRLRERYILTSLREEQLALVIADTVGPLRASAASLRQIEGQSPLPPKQALESIVQELQDPLLNDLLHDLSTAREESQLAPGKAGSTLMNILRLIQHLRQRTERLDQP